MNRIVLIGNGFDLAHGLKTNYKDFIDDYWEGFVDDAKFYCGGFEKGCLKLAYADSNLTLNQICNGDLPKNYIELKNAISEDKKRYSYRITLQITNLLLEHLSKKTISNNWVDIENEYYKFLIYQFDKSKYDGYYYNNINTLNDDYNHIKEMLNEYLTNVIKKTEILTSEQIHKIIYSPIVLKDFTDIGKVNIAKEEAVKIYRDETNDGRYKRVSEKTRPIMTKYDNYSANELPEYILSDLKNEEVATKYFDLKPSDILFLNFNYTDTEKHYSSNDDFEIETIHIHGELNSDRNPIIFGYGDELEENYSKLENLQDNAYLENIKSIKYQETDNYKRMLSFINSDQYQVIILGHSCGNSDRTLLNTLFEHENCVSIKPYYYQYKNDKGEIKDNYSDIVRNISRSFKDKKSMRDKVVNKTYTTWFSSDIKEDKEESV